MQNPEDTIQSVNEPQMESSQEYDSYPQIDAPADSNYEQVADPVSDSSSSYDDIGLDFDSHDDYNVDDILREYGYDDD
jgi:hypothetical protein